MKELYIISTSIPWHYANTATDYSSPSWSKYGYGDMVYPTLDYRSGNRVSPGKFLAHFPRAEELDAYTNAYSAKNAVKSLIANANRLCARTRGIDFQVFEVTVEGDPDVAQVNQHKPLKIQQNQIVEIVSVDWGGGNNLQSPHKDKYLQIFAKKQPVGEDGYKAAINAILSAYNTFSWRTHRSMAKEIIAMLPNKPLAEIFGKLKSQMHMVRNEILSKGKSFQSCEYAGLLACAIENIEGNAQLKQEMSAKEQLQSMADLSDDSMVPYVELGSMPMLRAS